MRQNLANAYSTQACVNPVNTNMCQNNTILCS